MHRVSNDSYQTHGKAKPRSKKPLVPVRISHSWSEISPPSGSSGSGSGCCSGSDDDDASEFDEVEAGPEEKDGSDVEKASVSSRRIRAPCKYGEKVWCGERCNAARADMSSNCCCSCSFGVGDVGLGIVGGGEKLGRKKGMEGAAALTFEYAPRFDAVWAMEEEGWTEGPGPTSA